MVKNWTEYFHKETSSQGQHERPDENPFQTEDGDLRTLTKRRKKPERDPSFVESCIRKEHLNIFNFSSVRIINH